MKKLLSFIFTFIIIFSVNSFALASTSADSSGTTDASSQKAAVNKLGELGSASGYTTSGDGSDVFVLIGYAVNIFFSILGIVFVVIILIAGYNYMIAQGDESKVKSSIATIRHATIGLLITIGSYAIYIFVWSRLTA